MARIYETDARALGRTQSHSQTLSIVLSLFATAVFALILIGGGGYGYVDTSDNVNNAIVLSIFFLIAYTFNEHLVFESLAYRKKARGEMLIFQQLMNLDDTYSILRNTDPQSQGVIDLIVVGPTGVYALNTMKATGRVSYKDHRLHQNNQPFPENHLERTFRASMELHDYLEGQFVMPVIVFTNRDVKVTTGDHPIEQVYVASRAHLPVIIRSGRTVLEAPEITLLENKILLRHSEE